MKPSAFNVNTVYEPTGETLLFNTLTGAFVAIDRATMPEVSALFSQNDATEARGELGNMLAESGFLVPIDTDERRLVFERSELGINDENRLDVIVMPNMNCNFACTYCYEDHEKSAMALAIEDRLVAWLDFMAPRFKVVLLSWFGGEPLLSYKTIVRVQRAVHDITRRHDVDLSCHMTTNGFLLSAERATELVSLGLRRFQITLDGPPETHNQTRPQKNGGATFAEIHANVCALARVDRDVSITLRVNYNDKNLPTIPKLLDSFPEDVRGQLDLALERIFGQEYSNYLDAMPMRDLGVTVESIYEYARANGYSTRVSQLGPDRLTYCYADRKNQFVFNFNGDVFKCTVDKFASKDRLGVLGSDGVVVWDTSKLGRWHGVPAFEDKCMTCSFMPMCMGGCRKVRGTHGTVGEDCKLPFAGFDKKLKYRYALERGESAEAYRAEVPSKPAASEIAVPVSSIKRGALWKQS